MYRPSGLATGPADVSILSFEMILIPEPPSRWYMKISTGGMPAFEVSSLRARTYRPSGVQEGDDITASFSPVRACGFDPSAFISHRFMLPPRSLQKRIVFPSGE